MSRQMLVFATGNQNKMREIREIFNDPDLSIFSMKEFGIHPDIVEDGKSFEENAMIKARAAAEAIPGKRRKEEGILVLADDSGLVIDALDGEPGIYSARYMGEDTPYEKKNAQLLQRLLHVPEEKRTARFVCAIAAVLPDGRTCTRTEAVEGKIAQAPAGKNGFGYDPIFIADGYHVTTAEMKPEEKNAISHRGKALRAMKKALEEMSSAPAEGMPS